MSPDPGSVSAVRQAAEDWMTGAERGVEADPESAMRAGRSTADLIFACRDRRCGSLLNFCTCTL